MSISRFSVRFMPALLVILILSVAAYAFAASNTVDESGAGDGQAAISGYTITAIRYTLNATTPTTIDSVQFNVAPTGGAQAPTTVKAQLNGAGSWFSCTNTSGTSWSCTLTGVTVQAASQLRIVAAQ
jgi:hypothetical protein